ncbi:MAG: methyltransferase [Paludibacteraceae bacterium]|nr:methyltransferase [Paludibacteraceae bacterium]
MSSPFFKFKQFTIWHDKCAMKVGTDGVLLGAWAPLGSRILDVGTGSGLIARMLMQRCPEAEVEGIDIDEAAVAQAKENGVRAFQARLQDWKSDIGNCYDLIVSNPPYFQNSLKNPDRGRELARHTDSLGYEELIAHSARLLKEEGQLALILPAEAEEEIRNLAAPYSLFPTHITRVYSKETKPARRVILAFNRKNSIVGLIEDSLVLEDEKGGRSAAYSKLCEEFYL